MSNVTYEIDAEIHHMDQLLEEFRDMIFRINSFNFQDRRAKLQRCREIEQQIKTVRQSVQLELNAIDLQNQRQRYQELVDDKDAIYASLCRDLALKRSEIDRERLHAEADATGEEPQGGGELLTTQQLITEGDRIQDKSQQAVTRMKRMVAEAEEIGIQTTAKLDNQIAQMEGIGEGLTDVEYNVTRAKHTVATIARNATSDRCIQIMCALIFIGIIIMVVLIAI